jgi:hypothetical protein
MKYIDSYDQLNEKKNTKTKSEGYRIAYDKLKFKIYKAKNKLEEINSNIKDSIEIKSIRKDIKNIDIKILQYESNINDLKYRKDYLKNKLKIQRFIEKRV